MNRTVEVQVPNIGDFNDVLIVEVAVGPGAVIAEGDTLIVLESDKASLDVPSPLSGTVGQLAVSVGDRVKIGDKILTLELAVASAAPPEQPVVTVPKSTEPTIASSVLIPSNVGTYHATPAIRRYARSLGVALTGVVGTGPHGRISREDVEGYVKAQLATRPATSAAIGPVADLLAVLPAWPIVDHETFGSVERQPVSRIGRISGMALTRNALLIPHVCNFDKADVTETEAFRKTLNAEAGSEDVKVSLLAFAVKAVVGALKSHPRFNASLEGGDLILKRYWNIGVAADTPEGLVVPVIRSADTKGLREIAAEMATLAAAARSGKLRPADMQGATFTISSLGGIGGTGFTPIINAPEVAILGMTRAEIQPVWDGAQFQPRLIQPLSLSWDHRAVDGVAAARFLGEVARNFTDLRRISV